MGNRFSPQPSWLSCSDYPTTPYLRRRLEAYRLGRVPLDVDRDAIVRDRLSGSSLTATAKKHGVSRASVVRFVHEARRISAPVGQLQPVSVTAAAESMA